MQSTTSRKATSDSPSKYLRRHTERWMLNHHQSQSQTIYWQNLRLDSHNYRSMSLGWKYSCFPICSQVSSHSILSYPLPPRIRNSQFLSTRKTGGHQIFCLSNVYKTTKDDLFTNIITCILKVYSSQKTNGQDWRREIWEEKRDIDFWAEKFPGIKLWDTDIKSLCNSAYCEFQPFRV